MAMEILNYVFSKIKPPSLAILIINEYQVGRTYCSDAALSREDTFKITADDRVIEGLDCTVASQLLPEQFMVQVTRLT